MPQRYNGSRSPPSLLPHFLVALYGLAIVYASLQPFAPWIAPPPGTPFFLFAPWPPRWTRFDVIANVVSYAPFGFFVALVPRRRPPFGRVSVAIAAGAALSFALESLQMFVPPRDANAIDLISNTAGTALGGLVAVLFARSTAAKRGVKSWRERWFVSGHIGDGSNRWPAVHRLDAARLFRLALETAPAGSVLHGVADEGVPVREVAEVIGRHLDLPVVAIAPEDAGEHFGWLAHFLAADVPATSALTRELVGWRPTHPGLIDDLDQGHYFNDASG